MVGNYLELGRVVPLQNPGSGLATNPNRHLSRGKRRKTPTLPIPSFLFPQSSHERKTLVKMLILLPIVVLLSLTLNLATSELVLEPGYAVSTVHDFNKAPSTVHPFALLPRHRSNDLILLDSTNSAFYVLPIPVSHQNEASVFSGKGIAGFSDGDRSVAMFDRPRSFAVDGRDNVYVADRINRAIRKITASGFTTTIAGGFSEKEGHVDGPAQNASFSNDFDLVYVPTMCALLISDRGTRLIRQIDLKPGDCSQKSHSGLGAVPVSAIAILCLLIGTAFGFVVRPFFATRTGSLQQPLYQSDMEALPNQSGETDADGLLRHQKRSC